jgi:hypothetical protein
VGGSDFEHGKESRAESLWRWIVRAHPLCKRRTKDGAPSSTFVRGPTRRLEERRLATETPRAQRNEAKRQEVKVEE